METKDPMISIHAFTCIHPRSGKTMQLLVMANDVSLRALLDSGSRHNFIDSAGVERAAILLPGCVGLRVAVANDDRLMSLGCC
jgi:hypothetical protein